MGNYDGSPDAGTDSTDLYSRVKLRASNKKVHTIVNDVFAAEDGRSVTARSRKLGSKIRKRVSSENIAAQSETLGRKNDFEMENSKLRTLAEVTVKENNSYHAWRRRNKLMNDQFADVQDLVTPDLLSGKGTAIEMLDALRNESPINSSNIRLDIGDLVWGRVKSYPWWPGRVFDEALASPSVKSDKRDDAILVAFYGDYTYAWLTPKGIVPFDFNFDENLRQTNVQEFLTGVKEATTEIKRRVALGLACNCQKNSDLQPMMMDSSCFKQIQKVREDFSPQEIIFFLKHLALSPRKNVKQNPYWIKNVANVSAYRKTIVKEFDETYALELEKQLKSLEGPAGITKENQKVSQARVSGLLDAEVEAKTLFRSDDLASAGNKRKISDCVEEFGMDRPVRMDKLKYLAGFVANQKVLEVQGESQKGTRSGSSTQPQNCQIEQESVRRDFKERMLTIKFPPQSILPSLSEVEAKFVLFGPLDEYSTCFFWKSSTYQLVFLHKSDAEAAYHHAIQNFALFSTSGVRYHLQSSDHDLNESGYSLGLAEHQKEIQLTSSLNRNKFAGEPMSALFQPSVFLPEKNQLKFSLKKSGEGTDCPNITGWHCLDNNAANSEIPKNVVPLLLPSNLPVSSTDKCTVNEQYGFKQFLEEINKEYHQAEAMNHKDSQNTTITNNVDISQQLINVLAKSGGILAELRSAYEHMF